MYPSSRNSSSALIGGNNRPSRDLPARLQRLVQAHSGGGHAGSGSTPGPTLLSTPMAIATLEQQLNNSAPSSEFVRNFGLPSSLEVDVEVLPGILGMPLPEAHPEDEVVQIEPQILPPPPPPINDSEAVIIDDDDDDDDIGDRWAIDVPSRSSNASSDAHAEWLTQAINAAAAAAAAATSANPSESSATESSSQTDQAVDPAPASTQASTAESGAGGGAAAAATAVTVAASASTESAESTDEAATGGASGTTTNASGTTATITDMSPEVRAALGDLEVPEGVDPSFLAALPSEMREEVIQEHLRMQRIRQRAQQNAIQIAHDSLVEVNPEFLAALPLNIQSEVLMQQRIEQQRQAAQSANPEDPVDTAAFFQNLPENLRQAVSFSDSNLKGNPSIYTPRSIPLDLPLPPDTHGHGGVADSQLAARAGGRGTVPASRLGVAQRRPHGRPSAQQCVV